MGASECIVQRWPSILPHLTRCSHNPRAPPQWWLHHRFTQAVYSLTLVLCVIIHVWCLCWCGCRCPWHCFALALSLSLSLSAPPPFLRHTHAGDLIHRVYDHLASPRHRGCVAMNTMRIGVTIPTGGHLVHSDLQGVRRRSTMKGLGGGGGVGLTYMRIYRVGQRGGECVCVCGELWTERKRVDDGCE